MAKMTAPKFSIRSTNDGHRILITADRTQLETPPVEHLALYAGLAVLAAAEIIEWPVAVAAAVGHFLARRTNSPFLKELGAVLGGRAPIPSPAQAGRPEPP